MRDTLATMQPHILTYPQTDSETYAKARYHYLLQIVYGETIAIDYCRIMSSFAPTIEARDFLLQQQKEEDTHLELLTDYVGSHSRTDALISSHLKKLDELMSQAIEKRDYVECVFIQNFIVEGLNVSLLRELEHHTDGILSEISTTILRDELQHMEFGVTEIQKILQEDTSGEMRKKLIRLQRKVLFHATLLAVDLTRESRDLGIPMSELAEKTLGDHLQRISRAGFALPFTERFLLRGMLLFFKL